MKRNWIILLMVLMLAFPMTGFAESTMADSAQALQAYLQEYREAGKTSFTIAFSADLLKTMKADDYAELNRICQLAGIDDFEMKVTRSGQIVFSSVVFGNPNVAACETAADVKASVADFMEQNVAEMELHCTEALFQQLFREGRMYRLMSEMGVEDFTMKGNSLNQIFLSDLQKTTVPYAMVASVSEAGDKIAVWREAGITTFNLLFDETVFPQLTRDDYRLMTFLGGAENYSLSYNTSTSMLLLSEVEYTDMPGAYCVSEEDVVSAIRAMGARGIDSFQLMLAQETYDKVYADSFARLYELQAQAGMTDAQLGFSSVTRRLVFQNATITADVTVLDSLEKVTAHVQACAERGDGSIAMLLSADVYDQLMDGVSAFFVSDAKFYDLIANAGIFTADDISFYRHSGAINLRNVHYYAGTSILRAVENGDLSRLSQREQQTLDAARQLAAECARESAVETARAIHDALCERIVYTNDETTVEDDCCIGALLNGRANCDGYADAMLLVGRLAGLNVRYQHGDSLDSGLNGMFSTHMWNLMELDGTWRMIDVTWDDWEEEAAYQWFNIGADRAARSHIWSEEMSVPLMAVTETEDRPVAEYFAANSDEVTAAAAAAQAAGYSVFDLYVAADSGLGQITVREAAAQGLSGSFYYTWIDSLMCLHVRLIP